MAATGRSYVDVGGRKMRVVAAGAGQPSVILEAGSGCWSKHWRTAQEQTRSTSAPWPSP